MDHHSHMGHGGMDMPSEGHRCNMNMLFTWDTTDLCIVFRQWHISSTFTLIISLLGVAALTAGYEVVRELSRRYEASSGEYMNRLPNDDGQEASSLLWSGRNQANAERKTKAVKAALYAVQVFYSFFIMLLFMTYNGWVMLAVAVGAFVGYLAFGGSTATKSVACH
ncbi:MAG: Ctr copper transporter [Lasallia pustulata]|uniref:Copper transport protein n=1 Tax=Lasallia pustulata TaxID=136370 RepID=A0A1W5D3T0_9LECA|nr:MAG: Ctr copper transporter [Lasallia pustulata]SLM37783.1 Ctr copper transporter [Lasallia pustulata]